MLWKRIAPLVLAAAVIATVLGAASMNPSARDCWPRASSVAHAL